MRKHASSGTDWEEQVGYSRAVRTGDEVHVAGTTATDEDGNVVAPGDPYGQTKRAIEIVGEALRDVDAGLEDVVRTRLFVADIEAWEAIGRAHAEAFGDVRPATTMVEVSRLIADDLVVEVEAVARCE